jgi:chemotaxis protein MotB
MPVPARIAKTCALLLVAAAFDGCCCLCPTSQMRTCQMQGAWLYQQNQALAAQSSNLALAAQQSQQALLAANQRLDNLMAERGQLQQKYIGLLDRQRSQASPLSPEATARFKKLQEKYPQFEFDPNTGVSKFSGDIFFASGSADIRPEFKKLLAEFSAIMNEGDARKLNVLVVGHTDDRPIGKEHTRAAHPTNWHLSTDRADSVLLELSRNGLKETRLGAAGYSMFQPVVENKDEASRRKNRRVEIFVLAPDALVAGWDPGWARE